MIAKIFSILLVAITVLFSPLNAVAEFHLSDSLLSQTQTHFCAENESEETKKNEGEEEEEEEEEPDCD